MSGLVVTDVTVTADNRPLVAAAGFTAATGEVTGLIGPNGAGKSTLIAAIGGLRRLASGSIAFDGADLAGRPPAERAQFCAYVEQVATTPERLTVRDAVGLGRLPFQSPWQARPGAHDEAVVAAALAALGLADFAGRLYNTLSGGEQQRVQIARALAQEPRLLLLDEPTSHLDIQAQLLVLDMLRRRAATGCTIVLALHDLNLAARSCDRLIVLKAGRIAADGRPADILTPELLLGVYGVHASVVKLPGSPHPLVVYDRPAAPDAPESD